MAPQCHQLHFILFPQLAPGHMIPMIDMARLFAGHDVTVTIVTTPLNGLRFKLIIDRAVDSGLPIRLLQLPFPWKEAGLPEGIESMDTIPSPGLMKKFLLAITMLQQPLEQSLAELKPIPSCLISDFVFPWTNETARKFRIPRLVFHGYSCFSLLCCHNIIHYMDLESVTSDLEHFVVPGLPDRIEVTKAQLPDSVYLRSNEFEDFAKQIEEAELTAYGVVVNSFNDLEPRYVDEFQKAKHNKSWCVGPVSLCNKDVLDKAERGNKSAIEDKHCLNWLDSKEPNSVVYVCLGSLSRLIPSQLIEIGLGLEASKCSFVWVIKGGKQYSELEKWFSEDGFVERNKERGLVIWGWAPQVLILSHQAIGGFLTHCGWNSTVEGVCAGVPMITWPMFAEQFLNEKLIVQVLGIGVRIGVSELVMWGDEEKVKVLVKKEDVEKAVKKLMDASEEGEGRRKSGKELGEMARRAMEEGGSSHLNMALLIQDIKNFSIQNKKIMEDK